MLRCLICELHEHGTLELPIVVAAETDASHWAIRIEKGLDIELRGGVLLTESFGVDGARHASCVDEGAIRDRVVGELIAQGHLPRDLIIVVELEEVGLFHCVSDGGEGLEVLHALEVVNGLERDGVVLVPTSHVEEVVVDWEVGVREVELHLAADLDWVVGLGELIKASFDAGVAAFIYM